MRADHSFFLLLLFFFYGCSSGNHSLTSNNDKNYKKVAEEKLGENHKIIFNSDSTYLIAFSHGNVKSKALEPPLRYFIYNTENDSILFQDNLVNGEINWINSHQIKVITTPEIVRGDEEKNGSFHGYIYDVKLNRKIDSQIINK